MKPSFSLLSAITIVFLLSCQSNGRVPPEESVKKGGEITIYRLAVGETFDLKIDSSFVYKKDGAVVGLPHLVNKIGFVERHEGKLSTISLKVNDHDTLFQMPLYKFDSVMFGYGMGRGFLIETSFDANEWGKD